METDTIDRIRPLPIYKNCGCCGEPFEYPDTTFADEYPGDAAAAGVCFNCARTFPPSLLKALVDEFDYKLKLRTGEMFRFDSAELHGEFVRLRLRPYRPVKFPSTVGNVEAYNESQHRAKYGIDHTFERGIDIRISQVLWCADAPDGS